MVKICVSGSKGKMGSRICALTKDDPELELTDSFDVGEEAAPLIEKCDCLIEFTTPEATMEHLSLCAKEGKPMVIGTTGLTDEQKEGITKASEKIPIVFSPNMSIGVNLLFKMVSEAAKALGSEYGVEIVEAHHVQKKDSPSGTAKELARLIKEAKGEDLKIPIESIREDEIVGEHTIKFESELDLIEITHSAKTRDIFVKGTLEAAKFVVEKKSGLFSMKDVIGL